jgi:hypothetical protein
MGSHVAMQQSLRQPFAFLRPRQQFGRIPYQDRDFGSGKVALCETTRLKRGTKMMRKPKLMPSDSAVGIGRRK